MSLTPIAHVAQPSIPPLALGPVTIRSRLIVGTGKYRDYASMQAAVDASGADVVTVAVRRERLVDAQGRSILEFLDTSRLTILPNTAAASTPPTQFAWRDSGARFLSSSTTPARSG